MNAQRTTCFRGLIAILLLVLMSSIANAAGPVRVGKADATATDLLPVNLGQQLGFFKDHGIDVKIFDFNGGSKMVQALTAGSIDIALGGGTDVAFIAKGAPMLAVCESMPSYVNIGVAVPYDLPVHALDQLKGKRIGVSHFGSLTDWMAKRLSEHEGWGENGVQRIAIGNGAAGVIAAFRTNTIDANISITSDIFNWEANKQARLLAPASSFIGNLGGSMIYASRNMIANEPTNLRRFLAAWLQTVNYVSTHKAQTIKMYREINGYSEGVMSKEYDLTTPALSHDCKLHPEFARQFTARARRSESSQFPARYVEALYRSLSAEAVNIECRRGQPAEERHAIRQQRSRPLVTAFEPWLREKLALISQKTKLAEAIRYALSRW